MAVAMLRRFWTDGKPLPLQSTSEAMPYPAGSA